jgi:hypothetical protein
MESPALLYLCKRMEDHKPFKIASVLQGGRSVGITSAYDAALYILEKLPNDAGGPKLATARAILLKCLAR